MSIGVCLAGFGAECKEISSQVICAMGAVILIAVGAIIGIHSFNKDWLE